MVLMVVGLVVMVVIVGVVAIVVEIVDVCAVVVIVVAVVSWLHGGIYMIYEINTQDNFYYSDSSIKYLTAKLL